MVSAEGKLVQALANVQKARAQLEAAANINNLGRGYEQVSGANVTLDVLANDGMETNVTGTSDPAEIARYLQLDKGTEQELNKAEAEAAAAKEAKKPEADPAFVGPKKQQ